MALTEQQKTWYVDKINEFNSQDILKIGSDFAYLKYTNLLRTDENTVRNATPEEFVHALGICMLCNDHYKYDISKLYHEQHFAHGSKGSKSDEVDLMIYDEDDLPFALWEFKAYESYNKEADNAIRLQLFGTAPLTKGPKLLVYATIKPQGDSAEFHLKCIDYSKYKSFDSWVSAGRPCSSEFPAEYRDVEYLPYISGGNRDLKMSSTQADFRAVAAAFHNDFFGVHPDNSLYINLVKCLLAKIYDERTTRSGNVYRFQVEYKAGKAENASTIFNKVNLLYKEAYRRYIDNKSEESDEIDPKEFSKENVKLVVLALESMSITKGAALHGDIIGAFFEEILRVGFKQDKGMYFTHANLVRFMVEAIGLSELTKKVWGSSNHPDNRLPYIIDPACGSGTFLLHAMQSITKAIKSNKNDFVIDYESEQFYNARMSDSMPNYWAENFIYGFDPKFIMAITAKVNMVLHGDGSAHIYKYDAYNSFNNYQDTKLRPINTSNRSISKKSYEPEMCETFDIVLSNPPFGVNISAEVAKDINKSFVLSDRMPSEALFIERCYQLLRPNGRLGLVLPESIFNAVDLMPVRLFIYRMFNIKGIVSLPRNVFIDTPTLTSLLFAQKKTASEVKKWDEVWGINYDYAMKTIERAKKFLHAAKLEKYANPDDLCSSILAELKKIADENEWVYKRGKNAEILPFKPIKSFSSVVETRDYYKSVLSSAAMQRVVECYTFKKTASQLDYEYSTFIVNEVGFKLSKRKEKVRPNQLCLFKGIATGTPFTNLNYCDEDYEVVFNDGEPCTVLDYIIRDVRWS